MHLTDEQLNEYLDGETNDRAQMESHFAACSDCSARLAVLQTLFSDIGSLPELQVAPDFAVEYKLSQPIQLPRSLRLTVILQAALTLIGIVIAMPFVAQFPSFDIPDLSIPTVVDLFVQLQNQWRAALDMLSTLQIPTMPEIPVVDVSNLFAMLIVIGVSLLWLVGNGLLLRNQVK